MVQLFKKHSEITLLSIILILVVAIFIFLPRVLSSHYVMNQTASIKESVATTTPVKVFVPDYVATPNPVKGIYMTSWTASGVATREPLVQLIKNTDINSVVIDIKDYSGKIVFPIEDNPILKAYG